MEWKDLDEKHRNKMAEIGNFSPTVNVTYKEIKGYTMDQDGFTTKTYWNDKDLRDLAESCIAVADWLDLRAEQQTK